MKKSSIMGMNIKKLFDGMRNFLKEGDLIYYMIAVYTGTVLNNFLTAFSKSIVKPTFGMILPSFMQFSDKNYQEMEELGFVDMKDFITQTISLIISIIVSYLILRFVLKIDKSKNY